MENEIDKLDGLYECRKFDIKGHPPRTDKLVEIIQSGANGIEPIFRIIIGLEESENGKVDKNRKKPLNYPLQIKGVGEFKNFDDYRLHLLQSVSSQTDGYGEGFCKIYEVPVTGGCLVVIEVPQSPERPHQNIQSSKWFIRTDGSTRTMKSQELDQEFAAKTARRQTRAHETSQAPEPFFDGGDKLVDATDNFFAGGATIVRLAHGAQLYIRVKPRLAPKPVSGTMIQDKLNRSSLAVDMVGRWTNGNDQRNEHGYIKWRVLSDDINVTTTYAQIFEAGEILSADTRFLSGDNQQIIPNIAIAEHLEKVLPVYLSCLRAIFDAQLPFDVNVGMRGIKGMLMKNGISYSERCLKNEIMVPITVENLESEPRELLTPFYHAMYDACGIAQRL